MLKGLIVEGRGGIYTVVDGVQHAYVLRAKKKFRRQQMTPLVGDRVLFSPGDNEEHGWLEEILPRDSLFLRPPVANIGLLCIVVSPAPQPDWHLVDKLLLSCRMQRITPMIIVNKNDLDGGTFEIARESYLKSDTDTVSVSAATGQGMQKLSEKLSGRLCCFTGQSGVGKSTLIAALLGITVETGGISLRIARGKQTTRHTSILRGNGLMALDTPGFSLLDAPEHMDPVLVRDFYPEFMPYFGDCRFAPCFHDTEPGCAVSEAAARGDISSTRLSRYRDLLGEIKKNWRERYD